MEQQTDAHTYSMLLIGRGELGVSVLYCTSCTTQICTLLMRTGLSHTIFISSNLTFCIYSTVVTALLSHGHEIIILVYRPDNQNHGRSSADLKSERGLIYASVQK